MNFEPVVRTHLADTVASNLKELINSGRFKAGDKLPSEPELMQQFGVGRSTIREAVKVLTQCGLLDVRQGLGTFVMLNEGLHEPLHQRLKRAGCDDLNEVRQLLELKAAEKAALNRTKADITLLSALLAKRKKAAEKQQLEACIEADISFHIGIATASKNEILADIYKSVAAQVKKSFAQNYGDTNVFIAKHQLHENLLQSIIDQDPKRAWKCVAEITGQLNII